MQKIGSVYDGECVIQWQEHYTNLWGYLYLQSSGVCTIISGMNALSVGRGGLGKNTIGSRPLNILTGTSEALMGIL